MTSRREHSATLERTSSFARSFYHPGRGGSDRGEDGNAAFPVPRSRRNLGRRQSSRRKNPSSSHSAVSESGLGGGQVVSAGSNADRANSWYVDALRQQGGTAADLDEILGEGAKGTEGFDDDEVLEQYRIMAQHEASLRVKENTGFDMVEYEKRRKLQEDEPQENRLFGGKKLKTRLPESSRLPSSCSTVKSEEPPPPGSRLHSSLLLQQQRRLPELSAGVSVRGASNVPHDEHVVRCLGCRGQLRVKIVTTLVSCSDCNTASPASSTRR